MFNINKKLNHYNSLGYKLIAEDPPSKEQSHQNNDHANPPKRRG